MKKPFAVPVIQALPAIDPAEPALTRWAVAVGRAAARIYMFPLTGTASVYFADSDAAAYCEALGRALSLKSRLIVAFRHQSGWEPQMLLWFTLFRLKRLGRRLRQSSGRRFRFPCRPALLFVHGYEVFRWGGPLARLFLPRFGAMPVHHTKLDSKGMERLYRTLGSGPYPLAIAPEGQVSYVLAAEPRIEPGAIRIGLTVAEKLIKERRESGSDEAAPPVEILPVVLYPEYGEKKWRAVEKMLRYTERLCGAGGEALGGGLRGRFLRCREIVLSHNEKRYGLVPAGGPVPEATDFRFAARLDAVIEKAMESAAAILRVPLPAGDTIIRLYTLRQICWDRIFPENVDYKNISPLEKAALDLRAGEAWYAARHLEIVDFSYYFHSGPAPNPPLAEAAEYAQNLCDFASRSMGGTYAARRRITPSRIRIACRQTINLSSFLQEAEISGAGRKAVIAQAADLLRERLRG